MPMHFPSTGADGGDVGRGWAMFTFGGCFFTTFTGLTWMWTFCALELALFRRRGMVPLQI